MPAMRARNPGRAISADRVVSFADMDAANAWLAQNPERVMGGVHFKTRGEQGWQAGGWLHRLLAGISAIE